MAAYRRVMTHVTCRLTAKNRDQLRNPTLGNRVWATFTFFSQDLEVGSLGTEVPQRGPGGAKPPKARSISRIFGCQTMHNFAYLAEVHERLVKNEKSLGCCAC